MASATSFGQRNPDIERLNSQVSQANQAAEQARQAAIAARQEADQKIAELTQKYESQLSSDRTYTSLAEQIAGLTGSRVPMAGTQAPIQLTADRNIGASDLANRLNFQVSDEQILNDYNTSKLGSLNSIVDRGNAQIAGIQERLNAAQTLLDQLPSGDPRRESSQVYVNQLKSDLTSVQSAVTDATKQIKDFKPITAGSPEAASQITSFREYLQLPEERATQQLRQIDPESYQTAISLGRKYREMAMAPIGQTQSAQTEAFRSQLEKQYQDYAASGIGATTTPETEALRRQIEGEAMAQLSLGAQLGAEEQRAYQQASRGAQAARGNIFGVAPAVEEAVTTGAAGEARKLARYGAATQFLTSGETTGAALARDVQLRNALQQSKLGAAGQFLASGQTTSDALRADLAFRDALLQNRLGAASGFIAGGPSLYNLGQARTGAQQQAFQNYIQANQALPGQFGQAPSTASPFYQVTQPGTPVDLTQTFANLYGSVANYQAKTYGDYVGAQASTYRSPAQTFGDIAGGLSNLIRI